MAKDEKAYAKRIAAQNDVATGVLTLIVGFICVVLVAIIAYILINGFGKLVDINFLTGDPEQFKAGGGIGPELFNSFYLLILTLVLLATDSLHGIRSRSARRSTFRSTRPSTRSPTR